MLLLQYTEFLSTALPPTEYAAMLPPISELVLLYGVDFEVAFQVSAFCRTVAYHQWTLPRVAMDLSC